MAGPELQIRDKLRNKKAAECYDKCYDITVEALSTCVLSSRALSTCAFSMGTSLQYFITWAVKLLFNIKFKFIRFNFNINHGEYSHLQALAKI